MSIDYRKTIPYVVKALIVVLLFLILYYVGIPVIKMLLPFIIAAFIAMMIEPQVKFMEEKLKFGRKLSSFIALLIFLTVFGTIITLLIYKVVIELTSLSAEIPNYFKSFDINNEMKYFKDLSQRLYLSIPPDAVPLIQGKISETINTLSSYANSFVSSMLSFFLNVIRILPESFIFMIITIISTFFISSDRRMIRNFIYDQFPESWKPKIISIKSDLIFAFIGFLKAQVIIITISILIASTGLTILNVEYAIILGIIIGVAELIPVAGTGLIYVPWILFVLANGNTPLALGLLAVFILGIVIRQVIEPKIIGVQIGIYPLVALISMYIGLRLYGIFGMILGPIVIILLRSLNNANIIHLWKEPQTK